MDLMKRETEGEEKAKMSRVINEKVKNTTYKKRGSAACNVRRRLVGDEVEFEVLRQLFRPLIELSLEHRHLLKRHLMRRGCRIDLLQSPGQDTGGPEKG